MKNLTIFSLGKFNFNSYLRIMGKSLSAKITFRNKYEHKISKLSDKELDKLQEKIIRKLCKSFADGLDFYNFSKNQKNKN